MNRMVDLLLCYQKFALVQSFMAEMWTAYHLGILSSWQIERCECIAIHCIFLIITHFFAFFSPLPTNWK